MINTVLLIEFIRGFGFYGLELESSRSARTWTENRVYLLSDLLEHIFFSAHLLLSTLICFLSASPKPPVLNPMATLSLPNITPNDILAQLVDCMLDDYISSRDKDVWNTILVLRSTCRFLYRYEKTSPQWCTLNLSQAKDLVLLCEEVRPVLPIFLQLCLVGVG